MKLTTERHLIYIDPVAVEFFFRIMGRVSISVILLTNGRMDRMKERQKDGRTNGREFNTSLAEVIND